ncbi:SIR2 family NAD-dependent protein deacylase [Geomesophilobacter sediminis]|uniref:protein acetyllysine N-acetyltransferase n=1 Tax=Geomesophilobacter sediminis TaxID=2798584 RepID=A0A8J7M386_9BACT|nr:Sir2 family NAD-dependent protein deacetylase [Geomesophilobacter sediminis]MBJ6727827.1 NAD-dependent deacetylase [Geomesophilobacter sediminis]
MPDFTAAAEALRSAEVLIVTAGAGMGVDSGLPDFRGDQGFWKAYPPYEKLRLSFVDAANPEHFERDPAFGWGFYGHRTNLYRDTVPHRGFALLRSWIERYKLDAFVVTSNVDGQFQKAGFSEDAILEVHGSIHHLQCIEPCSRNIWDNRETFRIDTATMRSKDVPRCPGCRGVARPNILMFGDYSWISDRTERQQDAFREFIAEREGRRIVVVELGAGLAVPTIRAMSERLGALPQARVVRINPREPQIHAPHLGLSCGALEGLEGIERLLG